MQACLQLLLQVEYTQIDYLSHKHSKHVFAVLWERFGHGYKFFKHSNMSENQMPRSTILIVNSEG